MYFLKEKFKNGKTNMFITFKKHVVRFNDFTQTNKLTDHSMIFEHEAATNTHTVWLSDLAYDSHKGLHP